MITLYQGIMLAVGFGSLLIAIVSLIVIWLKR